MLYLQIIFIISLILLIFIDYFIPKKASKTKEASQYMSLVNAFLWVTELENLKYFIYCDKKNTEKLKAHLTEFISRHGELSCLDDDEHYTPSLDFRIYFLDGETLFEKGGFNYYLESLQPYFLKASIQLTISSHIEEYDNVGLNHYITINGKEYCIFKQFKGYGWGEAAQRFCEILNDQLSIQQKEDRVYLINGANDGRCVFLSDAQFNFIDQSLSNKTWKPLKLAEWCAYFGVNPTNYLGN